METSAWIASGSRIDSDHIIYVKLLEIGFGSSDRNLKNRLCVGKGYSRLAAQILF